MIGAADVFSLLWGGCRLRVTTQWINAFGFELYFSGVTGLSVLLVKYTTLPFSDFKCPSHPTVRVCRVTTLAHLEQTFGGTSALRVRARLSRGSAGIEKSFAKYGLLRVTVRWIVFSRTSGKNQPRRQAYASVAPHVAVVTNRYGKQIVSDGKQQQKR